jgi:hypothetical protein
MVRVFPAGYNPIAAIGINPWTRRITQDEVQRHRELEKQSVLQDKKPIGLWFEPIGKGNG